MGYPQVKRTEGVSTTDIVGRMLTCSRVNHFINADEVCACIWASALLPVCCDDRTVEIEDQDASFWGLIRMGCPP